MRCLVFVLVMVLGAASAHAEDKAKAQQAFAEGRQHFDLGEYKEALESFKLAYRNFEDPTILFNIAQCQRQLGNTEDAVAFYRKYLNKVPDARNSAEVQATIDKLNATLAAERAAKATPPQGTLGEVRAPDDSSAAPTVVVSSPPPPPPPDRKPLVKKWWLWAGVGGAVVAVALGVGLGVGLQPHAQTASTDFGSVRF
jgi:tetratricopeptide (TPR) repeat protein